MVVWELQLQQRQLLPVHALAGRMPHMHHATCVRSFFSWCASSTMTACQGMVSSSSVAVLRVGSGWQRSQDRNE